MAAALSLKCGQCGVQLRSVAEAQTHGTMTGHSQFEVRPPRARVCMQCSDTMSAWHAMSDLWDACMPPHLPQVCHAARHA